MRSLVWNFINAKRLTFCLYQTIAFKLSDRFSNEPNKVVYLESFCFFLYFLFWVSAFRLFVTLPIFGLKSCAFKIQSHLNTISIAFAIAISITIETKFTYFFCDNKIRRCRSEEAEKNWNPYRIFLPYVVFIDKHHDHTCLRLTVKPFDDSIEILWFWMARYFFWYGYTNTQSICCLDKRCNTLCQCKKKKKKKRISNQKAKKTSLIYFFSVYNWR